MTTARFIEKIRDKRGGDISVGLYGLGKGNLALIESLSEIEGCSIVGRSDSPVCLTAPRLQVITGEAAEEIAEDVLIVSPSVRRDRPCFLRAQEKGTIVTGECDIFFSENIGKRFVISGSDGKSTTTTLASRILAACREAVYPIGNIGVPYSTVPLSESACYVCELSSFNLEYIEPKSERALLTNITDNHLDWHKSIDGYIKAKLRIYKRTQGAVVPEGLAELALKNGITPNTLFSASSNYKELSRTARAEHYVYREAGWLTADGERVIPLDEIPGLPYVKENSAAALALTLDYADLGIARETISSFTGLGHRCEVCHSEGGVSYIDSSIDTSPARAAATISALGKDVLLILGGRGKSLSFEPLRWPIKRYAKRLSLYGELGAEIASWIERDEELAGIPHRHFNSLERAVIHLAELAEAGDTVLLSPSGTSYGEFSCFEERGRVFADTVADFLNKKK